MIAKTPTPPYYAVIFTSLQTTALEGYNDMATKMMDLAATQPGYLGVESVREDLGITVSYWADLESIKAWKNNAEHLEAKQSGRAAWYTSYRTRIARVEREYGM